MTFIRLLIFHFTEALKIIFCCYWKWKCQKILYIYIPTHDVLIIYARKLKGNMLQRKFRNLNFKTGMVVFYVISTKGLAKSLHIFNKIVSWNWYLWLFLSVWSITLGRSYGFSENVEKSVTFNSYSYESSVKKCILAA